MGQVITPANSRHSAIRPGAIRAANKEWRSRHLNGSLPRLITRANYPMLHSALFVEAPKGGGLTNTI
jgi:hypothetical protein